MPFLQTLLNIVIFLLCLSFVVCIHELGHFSMAKLFKVYCFEYSIGFGPAIFHKKVRHRVKKGTRPVFTEPTKEIKNNESQMSVTDIEPIKPLDSSVSEVNQGLLNLLNASQKSDEERVKKEEKPIKQSDKYDYYYGETYISIRCLPLGGYVSMAGEDGEENEDGVKVPKERTIPGINHFKQIIIMMAGIVMNFLLAFILFFADFAFCPQQASIIGTNAITVSEKINDEESPAYTAGLRTGDKILTLYQTYNGLLDNNDQTKVTDGLEFPAVADRQEITCYQNSGIQTADDYSFDSISYAIQDVLAHNNSETLTKIPGFEGLQAGENSTRVLHITYLDFEDQTTKTLPDVTLKTQLSNDAYTFGKLGISVATEEFYFTAGEAFVNAGKQFGYLFVNIYKALGGLFTPSGWQSMGGIISVYQVSAQGVASQSAGYFILLWGYISLNLGCFNLLPFPGLDGWQTLIAIAESASRKKFSTKFKGIANMIGLGLLMVLAVVLVIKDIFFPVM